MTRAKYAQLILPICLIFFGHSSFSQKKKIDQDAWYEWKNISSIQQSQSGDWVAYQLDPLVGDKTLYLRSTTSDTEVPVARGEKVQIHFEDQFIAFMIVPEYDTIRQLKLDKVKKSKFPKDTLGIYFTAKDSLAKIPKISSFKIAEEGNWIAYLSSEDLRPKPKKKKKKRKRKKKKKSKFDFIETEGTTLTLYNPVSGENKTLHRVTDYEFDKKGQFLSYSTSEKGDKDSINLHVMNLTDFSIKTLIEKQMDIQHVAFDEFGSQLVFLSSTDTGKVKNYILYHWKEGQHNALSIVDSTTKGMPEGWTVSKNKKPFFSKSGERIFLGTNKIQRTPPEDTLLESEKVQLDIWHYQDKKIQPEQLSGLKKEQSKAYLAVYLPENRKFNQLADETIESIQLQDHGDAYYALGIDTKPYEIERTWTSDWKADFYVVSVKGGASTKIKEGITLGFGSGPSLSPSGQYLMWFNPEDSLWKSYDILSKKDLTITHQLSVTFESESNGVPGIAQREAAYGWTMIDENEYFLVRDKFNIWALHPTKHNRTFCLTQNVSESNDIKFSLIRTERDSTYYILDDCLIKGVDQNNFNESIYKTVPDEGIYRIEKIFETPHRISYLQKARNSDKVLFARKDFQTYPDLESTDLTFSSFEKITDANPQQDDYNWGTVEHVDWYAFDSLKLRGMLYKPEDFDSTKSYPMIVYFYSLNSQNIHEHYIPKPVYSYINYTEYVSNGYLVFVPDIKYGEPGHPGKDAYNCLVSGTQHLYRKYDWIDSTRLGIQGQSWGGYQTVQIITMTDMFKAAMAGAAVGNMFSAYGGIRWNSGLARTFQYEEGQSRIGATIWEKPELYIENSPVFHLHKVNTPLFLRHNDKDGAVPWYQSIELYVGLRRLQKPVWLLNYNDGDHWNLKLPHRIDYNIRMKQFFDHYLMGAPMPIWMKEGRKAIDKETKDALELEK